MLALAIPNTPEEVWDVLSPYIGKSLSLSLCDYTCWEGTPPDIDSNTSSINITILAVHPLTSKLCMLNDKDQPVPWGIQQYMWKRNTRPLVRIKCSLKDRQDKRGTFLLWLEEGETVLFVHETETYAVA